MEPMDPSIDLEVQVVPMDPLIIILYLLIIYIYIRIYTHELYESIVLRIIIMEIH